MFEESWQRLTLPQRAVLRALVSRKDASSWPPTCGPDIACRAPTVQAALAASLRQNTITKDSGRYVTVDSLYREWVARKTY